MQLMRVNDQHTSNWIAGPILASVCGSCQHVSTTLKSIKGTPWSWWTSGYYHQEIEVRVHVDSCTGWAPRTEPNLNPSWCRRSPRTRWWCFRPNCHQRDTHLVVDGWRFVSASSTQQFHSSQTAGTLSSPRYGTTICWQLWPQILYHSNPSNSGHAQWSPLWVPLRLHLEVGAFIPSRVIRDRLLRWYLG